MANDDDQRQVERVTPRAAVEVENEIPCPEAGEEVRGQKRPGEDVEELAAKAEEQHLDADIEVPAHDMES